MNEHPIDAYFRKNLEDHQIPVPDLVWENIAAGLPPKRRAFPYLWVAATVAVLLGTTWLLRIERAQYTPQLLPLQQEIVVEPVSELEALLHNTTASQPATPVVLPLKKRNKLPQTTMATSGVLDELAFEASMEAIRLAVESMADTAQLQPRNFRVLVELAKPQMNPNIALESNNPPIERTDFNLLEYSSNQLNNLIHGAPLESPLKGRKNVLKNPAVEKITQFFKSQID
jgi:hypothetical protein